MQETLKTYDNSAGKALPNPKASRKTKSTKSWKKDTINYYIDNKESFRGPRRTQDEIQSNWDFFNGLLSKEEVLKSLDPLNLTETASGDINGFENYNIVKNPLETLAGEALKRKNDVKALAINPHIVNAKDREWMGKVKAYLNKLTESEQSPNQEEVQKALEGFDMFRKQDLQSSHEKLANQLLNVFQKDKHINAKQKFNTGFRNYEINGESIYHVYRNANVVDFRAVDSKNFYVIGLTDNWVENAQAWIEETWMNPYKIIEMYPDLTKSEISDILDFKEGEANGLRAPAAIFNGEIKDAPESVFSHVYDRTSDAFSMGVPMLRGSEYMDSAGNILVANVEWRGLRKLGKLMYLDPQTGEQQSKWVDEDYPIDENAGETIEFKWFNEIMRGVKIGDKIYHNIGPSDTQMRSNINPHHVTPNYVGYIHFNHGGIDKSRLESLKPYQRDYNVYANKLRKLWTEHIGKVAVVDVASMPSNMEPDEWYAWVKETNMMFINSFEMGQEGMAKGLLAGNMQQRGNSIDMSLMNEISEAIQMLEYNKRMVNEQSGIPEARQGDLTGKEGLGTSQQAIMSSSNQTEYDFFILDLLKVKVAEVWLEYKKVVGKEVKETIQYVLDDLSQYIIEFDGEMLNEADFNVQITDSSTSFEMTQRVNMLVHPAMQNGTIGLVDALQTIEGTPSEIVNRLKAAEEEKRRQAKDLEDQKAKNQQQIIQMQEEAAAKAWERKKEELLFIHGLDLEKIELENSIEADIHSRDTNQNNIEDVVELDAIRIKAEADAIEADKERQLKLDMQAKDLKNKLEVASKKAKTTTTK